MISILMPVCDPDPRWLDAAIESVRAQVYRDWQLCIVDDASVDPSVRSILSDAEKMDPRIEVQRNPLREGISRSSNRALSIADGPYVALLDHDDELTPDALLAVARSARDRPFDVLYSDEDKLTRRGRLRDPTFKPGRSRELLLSCMYFGHLCVYRRSFVIELGGFDAEFDGGQDHDLALRAEAIAERVVHLPLVLYHWRMAEGSVADPDAGSKPWAYEAGRRAIEAALRRSGERARIAEGVARGHARIIREPPPGRSVSVLYCACCGTPAPLTHGEPPHVRESVARRRETQGVGALSGSPIDWIRVDEGRSAEPCSIAARWNAAVDEARGDVLIFLDGVRPRGAVRTEDWSVWIGEMISQLLRDPVGVVGVRVSSESGLLLHMGVVLGGQERIRVQTGGLGRDEPGPLGLAQSIREVSAVTGGCLAIRRSFFDTLGGFDPRYQASLHDVDLCMRARAHGRSVLYDPHAECLHFEAHQGDPRLERHGGRLPRTDRTDLGRFERRWREALLARDPCSNPSFHDQGAIFAPRFRSIVPPHPC